MYAANQLYREIDVDDWQQNTLIKGNHPDTAIVVARFWNVVRGMDQPTRSALVSQNALRVEGCLRDTIVCPPGCIG